MSAISEVVYAVYSDGYENGRRVRHVFSMHPTLEEAKAAVGQEVANGYMVAIRKCKSRAAALALEVTGAYHDGEEPLDRLHAIDDFYNEVS